jgi:hypothetical protein
MKNFGIAINFPSRSLVIRIEAYSIVSTMPEQAPAQTIEVTSSGYGSLSNRNSYTSFHSDLMSDVIFHHDTFYNVPVYRP